MCLLAEGQDPPEGWVALERVRRINNVPTFYEYTWLPAALVPGLEQMDLRDCSLFTVLDGEIQAARGWRPAALQRRGGAAASGGRAGPQGRRAAVARGPPGAALSQGKPSRFNRSPARDGHAFIRTSMLRRGLSSGGEYSSSAQQRHAGRGEHAWSTGGPGGRSGELV